MSKTTARQIALRCCAALLLLGTALGLAGPRVLRVGAANPFADVPPGHPAATAIDQLHARGVIKGYPTTPPTFGPDEFSLRAQMAALIGRAMGWGDDEGPNPFTDRCIPRGCIDEELWGYVATLASRDVALGYDPTTYAPFDNVLKQQVILFIARARIATGEWELQPDDPRLYPGSAESVADHRDIATYVHYAGAPPDAPTTLDTPWVAYATDATRGWFARALWQAYPEGLGPPVAGMPSPSPSPSPSASPTASPSASPTPSPSPSPAGSRIAIPSYFYPDADPNGYWEQLNAAAPTVGLAIINPDSGPGTASNPDYVGQVTRTRAANIVVLGYVATGYGARPLNTVTGEIDDYFDWYGVDGIFLDEASSDCADVEYYRDLYEAIKARGTTLTVVINPGTQTGECYMAVADIVLTFEDTYSEYATSYSAPAWVANYPAARFWHLIHSTATIPEMEQAVALSKERHAGWVYVTPDVEDNPWDTLPGSAYWQAELTAVP